MIKADSETVRRQESSEINALGKNRFVFIKKRTLLILSVKVESKMKSKHGTVADRDLMQAQTVGKGCYVT